MAAKKRDTGPVEQQLEAAKKKIAELEIALADEQEHNKSFLEVFLDGQYIDIAEEKEKAAAEIRLAATQENLLCSENRAAALEKEANIWRRASRILRDGAANEFPRAQTILAASDNEGVPSEKAQTLLVALMFKMLAVQREKSRGLQKDIVQAAIKYRLNMSGLSERSVNGMLSAARKNALMHDFEI